MRWEVPCIVCFPFVNDKDEALSGFEENVNDNICSPTTMLFGKMKEMLEWIKMSVFQSIHSEALEWIQWYCCSNYIERYQSLSVLCQLAMLF